MRLCFSERLKNSEKPGNNVPRRISGTGTNHLTRQPATTRNGRKLESAAAFLLTVVVPVGVYALAAMAAAGVDDRIPAEVTCFDPANVDSMSAGRMVAAVVMALAAVAFLFVIPGLLATLAFMRMPSIGRTAHAWSLVANSAALILLCLVLRNTVGITRASLTAAWLGWTALLFAMAWQPGHSPVVLARLGKRYGGALLIGLIMAVAAVVTLFPEQFLQCFAEDGTETYELARSLRHHPLPYWELETWQWETGNRLGTVVVNPSLINSYWTCGLQTLLGDGDSGGGELATRLPYWVWWLAVFAASIRLAQPLSAGGTLLAAVALGLLMFIEGLLFSFYVGYNQYMADLANPGVPDALFTLCLLLALDCLRQRDRRGFAVCFVLASLVLYAGPIILAATLAAAWLWRPIERSEVVRWGVRTVELLLAILLFYLAWGWWEGSLRAWVDTIDIEYVADYLSPISRWKSGPLFFGYFLLLCGGVAAWGLARAFRRGPWQRTVATATLLYLLVVLLSGFKNVHYLSPLLPIPVILFFSGGKSEVPRYAKVAAICSLVFCIFLCWPKQRQTFTLNRDLGARTTIATHGDSYLTAVQWARLRLVLIEQGSWYFDAHTWVAYSQLDPRPAQPRSLVLTDGGPPSSAYYLVASRPVEGTQSTARLYARGGSEKWINEQTVLRPPERYPTVFRPLAEGRFSPHNNRLLDLELLRWPW